MKKAILLTSIAVAVFTIQSCENKSLDQEIEEYCNCQKTAQSGEKEMAECMQIANEISDKYQFDPEAVEEIRTKIKNCTEELNVQND